MADALFLTRELSDPAPTVDGYGGELDGEVFAVRSGDKTYGIAGADGRAESQRKENEAQRVVNEQARVEAETARESAETQRQSTFETNEAAREAAQDANDTAQAKNNADQAANNAAMQKLSPVILTEGQYDPDTLEPTIEGEPNRMYFVPMGSSSLEVFALAGSERAEAAAEAGNLYVEWMWIDGAWEQMGTSQLEAKPITTDEIDEVTSDASPQGEEYLSLTGLSYLWARVKAWGSSAFAALTHQHSAADVTSGTLPIARGGTDATTASGALAALGAASEEELQDVRDSLSQLVKVKEVSGNTSVNGTIYVGLSERECVVICAISPTMINGDEAIICNAFLNNGTYGIACRSATYPHADASTLEVSLKVYYMSLNM